MTRHNLCVISWEFPITTPNCRGWNEWQTPHSMTILARKSVEPRKTSGKRVAEKYVRKDYYMDRVLPKGSALSMYFTQVVYGS